MKKILKISALSLLTTPIFAQYAFEYMDQDALRLTMSSLQGNARFASMGGAFGALGGNFSALSTNPASIGIYRSNEFSFTPALTIGQTEVKPGDAITRQSDPLWNFNLGNFGMVAAWDISKSESANEWKMVQFGIGLNRLTDFWNRSGYTRYAQWTYLDVLTHEANITGNLNDDWFRGLAFDAGLIKFDTTPGMEFPYWNELAYNPTKGLMQRQVTKTTGAINEFVMSFGANYGDIIYLGATLGMPSVNFSQDQYLRETDEAGAHFPRFREWSIRENLKISGRGINLKLGVIARPTDFMRVGLAFHTPTRYSLKEEFSTTIQNAESTGRYRSPVSAYDYSIRTPMRVIGSLGFVFNRVALLGIEYEMVNYQKMRINDEHYSYDNDNEFIEETYRMGGTFKLGAEYRLDVVSLRAGYNYTFTPYADNMYRKFSGHSLSAGLGFTLGSTTIDLAYVNALRRSNMSPYPGMPNDFFNRYTSNQHQMLVTFGWRF